ncbi:hypothetical protein CTA1_1265 [Colletotrichum tanaceti]|uniref:NAD-specific glutamate dehydrogenase n=1 Tax=Colletotrichum tanaceti TaxID=1306861 RepID=A0A4U6XHH5_9PEZI|nr:hypothetical protein CTA1_1265 [Colletotrichum tanaceti]
MSSSSEKTSSPRLRRAMRSVGREKRVSKSVPSNPTSDQVIDAPRKLCGKLTLLLLAELGRRQLDLLLGADNLVAHGVKLILLVGFVTLETGTSTLTLDPVVAGRRHLAVHDGPDLLRDVLGELGRVGNNDDTTLELLEGLGQGTERVTVEVVGGLVEDDQVGTLPGAGGEDDLDTLATRQTAHARVGNQLGVEAKVGAVGLDLLADQGAELTRGEGLLHVHVGNHLLVRSQELVTGQPDVVGRHHGGPALVLLADVVANGEGALVLVRVLELSARVDANDAALSALDLEDLVHGLLISVRDDLVGTVHRLTILTSLETPLDVLRGGLVQVVINVGEGVLLDVGDTDVLVLVDLTLRGDELTGEDVDERRLAGTVGANDGDTGAEGALERDVLDLGLAGARVLERHLGGTQDGLGLGLDTLEETGLGEGELHLRVAELVVRLGGGVLLDKLLEVTTVALELEALVVNDVLADVVEEGRVVGDDDGGAGGVLEVLLEPLDVLHVQVVGGLVEKQDIGGLEDGTAQGELHLPTTREGRDLALDHHLGKAELVQLGLDIGLGGLDSGVLELLHGPLNGGHLGVGRVEVVLDEDGLDLGLLGETLDLLVVDGAHEGGLAGTVGAAKTVALATLETEVGLVEQDLGTVGEGEGAVAEILTLLIIGVDLGLLGGAGRGALAEVVNDLLGVLVADDDGDVGLEGLDPDDGLNLLLVDQLAGDVGGVLEDDVQLLGLGLGLGGDRLLELGEDDVQVGVVADLGDLAIDDVADTGKGVEGLLGLLTGLGVGQVVVVLLKTGHHLGQERSDNVGVVDELAHVVDDDGGLTLDGGLALGKTTVKEGNHEGKSGLLNLGDEGGGTEQVNSLGDVLGLGDTLDELGDEALDITVDNELADLLHGLVGALLDLLLGVPHGLGDDRDEVGDAVADLGGGGADDGLEDVESGHLLLPLLGLEEGLLDGLEEALDGVGVDGLGDGEGSLVGSILDRGDLVAGSGKDIREKGDEEGLDVSRNLGVLCDGGDGNASLLTGASVLLVVEELPHGLDAPAGGSLSALKLQ